jgi:hypothetical protein
VGPPPRPSRASRFAEIYERFLSAREAAIIAEIRRVCGTASLIGATDAPEEA